MYKQTWVLIKKLKEDKISTMERANNEYREICEREQNNRYPKKKKKPDLPKEVLNEIRDDVLSTYQPIIDKINANIAENTAKLKSLESTVIFEPCDNAIYKLTDSWSSTYSSVGDSVSYAKGAIMPLYSLLKEYNFHPQIREVISEYSHSFELWADCEPYMFDVLQKHLTEQHMLSANVNPLVLWPFARDLYDKWLQNHWQKRTHVETIVVRKNK